MGQVLEAKATQVIEADETGKFVIPAELLRGAQPFSRYQVKAVGERLSIEPKPIEVTCLPLVLPECAGAVICPTGHLSLARKALAFVQTLPEVRLVPMTAPSERQTLQSPAVCAGQMWSTPLWRKNTARH